MGAVAKTKLLLRLDVPISMLVKNEDNPNKMSERAFNLLCDNLEETGLTDPILVRPLNLKALEKIANKKLSPEDTVAAMALASTQLMIVGGHHRYDAALYIGFTDVPVTVIMDPKFDADKEKFQIVRMNTIRGKMDAAAFFKMYQSLSETYSDVIMQDAFGFAEEAEFRKLIEQTSKALPDKALQDKFKEAAKEIKTIDGLSKLLNEMFTKYGNTLPYGYMVVDYGGQRSMWVRVEAQTMKALDILSMMCVDNNRTMDDVLGGVVKSIAKGEVPELLAAIMAGTPSVKLPDNLQVAPTKNNLEALAAL